MGRVHAERAGQAVASTHGVLGLSRVPIRADGEQLGYALVLRRDGILYLAVVQPDSEQSLPTGLLGMVA